jgi:hypothetical protein
MLYAEELRSIVNQEIITPERMGTLVYVLGVNLVKECPDLETWHNYVQSHLNEDENLYLDWAMCAMRSLLDQLGVEPDDPNEIPGWVGLFMFKVLSRKRVQTWRGKHYELITMPACWGLDGYRLRRGGKLLILITEFMGDGLSTERRTQWDCDDESLIVSVKKFLEKHMWPV